MRRVYEAGKRASEQGRGKGKRPVRLVAYFGARFWPGEGKVEARDEPARGWCRIGEGPACKTW